VVKTVSARRAPTTTLPYKPKLTTVAVGTPHNFCVCDGAKLGKMHPEIRILDVLGHILDYETCIHEIWRFELFNFQFSEGQKGNRKWVGRGDAAKVGATPSRAQLTNIFLPSAYVCILLHRQRIQEVASKLLARAPRRHNFARHAHAQSSNRVITQSSSHVHPRHAISFFHSLDL